MMRNLSLLLRFDKLWFTSFGTLQPCQWSLSGIKNDSIFFWFAVAISSCLCVWEQMMNQWCDIRSFRSYFLLLSNGSDTARYLHVGSYRFSFLLANVCPATPSTPSTLTTLLILFVFNLPFPLDISLYPPFLLLLFVRLSSRPVITSVPPHHHGHQRPQPEEGRNRRRRCAQPLQVCAGEEVCNSCYRMLYPGPSNQKLKHSWMQNVTSSSTVVASLEAARDQKAPVILQMSQGGAAYFAGKVICLACGNWGSRLTRDRRGLPMETNKLPLPEPSPVLTTFAQSLRLMGSRSSSTPTIAPRSFCRGWMAWWMRTRNTSKNTASPCSPAIWLIYPKRMSSGTSRRPLSTSRERRRWSSGLKW